MVHELRKRHAKAFELGDEAISVAAYRDNFYAVQMLEQHGFNLNTEGSATSSGVSFQLDTFDIYKGERCIAKRNDYGGIKIERRDQGVLRNSHELAVAVLTLGLSILLCSPWA